MKLPKEPFAGVHPQVIIQSVQVGKRPPMPATVESPDGWTSLMTQCWAHDPPQRPSFDYISKELNRILAAHNSANRLTKRDILSQSVLPSPMSHPDIDMSDTKLRRLRNEQPASSPKVINLRLQRPSSIQSEAPPASPTNGRDKKDPEVTNAHALFQLALAKKNGQGMSQDIVEAFRLFRKAAEQNHAAAQYNVAVCLATGQGTKKDPAEAIKWYRRAAEQDHTLAQSSLGSCCFTGLGTHVDYVEALKWFRKAADKGDARGEYYIGHCYQSGYAVSKDPAEAFKWYGRSADHGLAEAQYEYGNCFFNGWGTGTAYDEAFKWYQRASEQGYTPAQLQLAFCFQHGHGVIKNIEEARRLYEPLAKAGNQRAIRGLKRLG